MLHVVRSLGTPFISLYVNLPLLTPLQPHWPPCCFSDTISWRLQGVSLIQRLQQIQAYLDYLCPLCDFWQFVSFKELFHFIRVIKCVGIELLAVFFYYFLNVHGMSSDDRIFVSDISNWYLISSLVWLESYQFYWSVQRSNFFISLLLSVLYLLSVSLNFIIYFLFIYT